MPQYADQLGFAAGTLIASPKRAGVITPVKFGVLQDAQLDFSADLKELYGQGRYAIALAPGKTKVEIKAKFAAMSGAIFNEIYFGATPTATQILFNDSEAAAIPGAVAYTATVTNSANFVADMGVYYAATGQPLTQVAAAPAVGEYSVAAGTYTFSAADKGLGVYISYTSSSTSGVLIPITNVRMGIGPSFQIMLSQPFDGRQATYIFNNCQASKLSLPTKQDDFQINEIDFMVAADAGGNIGTISLSV